MRLDEVDKQITSSDLEALETFADRIFGKVGIDVEFTRHFLDRVNDERNGEQITASELTRLFKQEYKRWGKPIAQMGPDAEAVMKDLATDINMPFALRWDRDNNELDLIVKTVMRKKDFKTSNREFAVEKNPHSDGNSLSSEENDDINNQRQNDLDKTAALVAKFAQIEKGRKAKAIEDPIKYKMDADNSASKLPYKHYRSKAASYASNVKPEYYFEDEEVVNEESGIFKLNKEDPNNPEVHIQGYGRLMLNQIEASVVRKLEELTKMAERGDFEQIQSLLNKDVMQTMIQSIVDTKAELQSIRRKGGPKSRGIAKESLYDLVTADIKIDEGMFDKLKVLTRKKNYAGAAESLHKMLQRKYKENGGKWRHSFSYYVAKIASGWKSVERSALNDYYLENYESAFITESGGVGKVVPGVNTTIDVGPDEIKKQAKKFGNAVDKDGLPKNTFR
jgi:hypothetical protein